MHAAAEAQSRMLGNFKTISRTPRPSGHEGDGE
jgi:hypothetical protein